jgi:predicted RNA-binding protein associated with RNAse of E/G family
MMERMVERAAPGEAVAVRFSKWGGAPHWEMDGSYLGADQHGHWVGARPPVMLARPGRTVADERHLVGLFPHDAWFVVTFYERTQPALPEHVELYVDITTVPHWERTPTGLTVRMVDLDLDVFRTWTGDVLVDDEDEFAAHRVSLGYPADIVDAAERSCAEVAAAVVAGAEPFGTTGSAWLAALT